MIKETNKTTKGGQSSLRGGEGGANSAEASWGRRIHESSSGQRTFQAVGTENWKFPRRGEAGHFQKGDQRGLVNKRQIGRKQAEGLDKDQLQPVVRSGVLLLPKRTEKM